MSDIMGIFQRLKSMDQLDRIRIRAQKLKILHDIGKEILAVTMNVEHLLITILEAGIFIIRAEEGTLIIKDENTNDLYEVAYKKTDNNKVVLSQTKVEDNILNSISQTKKPIRLYKAGLSTGVLAKALLGVPLLFQNQFIGAIVIYNLKHDKEFDDEDEFFLSTLANYAAMAYQYHKLHEKTEILSSLTLFSQNLLTSYDLEKDLDFIISESLRVLDADIVTLYEFDIEIDDFKMPPIVKGSVLFPENVLVREKLHRDAIVFKLLKNREPFFVYDAKNDWFKAGFYNGHIQTYQKSFVFREDITAAVGVPLLIDDEIVGVLFVNYRRPQKFSPAFREKLKFYSNFTALVIHNLKVFNQSIENGKKLSVLNAVGQVLNESETLEFNEILRVIHTQIGKLMDASNFYVAIFDKDTETVEFKFVSEKNCILGNPIEEWASRKSGNGLTEYLIHTGKSLLLDHDVESWMIKNKISTIGKPAKSWLGSPLIARGKVIGAIALQDYETERKYSEKHKEILGIIASQAAIALDNSILFHKTKDYGSELERLSTLSQGILEGGETSIVLNETAHAACELTNGNQSTILLIKPPDFENIYIESTWGNDTDTKIHNRSLLGRSIRIGSGITGIVAKRQEPIIVPDVSKFTGYIEFNPATKSEIAVPILRHYKSDATNYLLGVINVESHEINHFTELHFELLKKLAIQVAIAIEQKRQIQELESIRQHYKEASDLANIGFVYGEDLHIANNRLGAARQYAIDIIESDDIQSTKDYARRIRKNIDDFLDLLEELRKEINPPEPVEYNVHELLRATVDSVKKSSLIIVKFSFGNFSPNLVGFKSQISHVFRVVIFNAIEVMNGEGTLSIATSLVKKSNLEYIEVGISDTGPGIAEDIQNKIFSLNKPPRKKRGVGLGLPWSSLVLRITGGDINFETELGKGTTMKIVIPRNSQPILAESKNID